MLSVPSCAAQRCIPQHYLFLQQAFVVSVMTRTTPHLNPLSSSMIACDAQHNTADATSQAWRRHPNTAHHGTTRCSTTLINVTHHNATQRNAIEFNATILPRVLLVSSQHNTTHQSVMQHSCLRGCLESPQREGRHQRLEATLVGHHQPCRWFSLFGLVTTPTPMADDWSARPPEAAVESIRSLISVFLC